MWLTLTRQLAFLIGSIEEVNKRISRLDRKLQSYTELVVESRASEKSDDYVRPPSSTLRDTHSMRGILFLY